MATPMDVSDLGGGGGGGERNRGGSNVVNSRAGKMAKNGRGRTATAPPRPEAKVFFIEPTDFRRTVQELTAQEPAPPPRLNNRLARLKPPPLPLRPSVSYPKLPPQPPHLPNLMPTQAGQRPGNPFQGFGGLAFPGMQHQHRLSPTGSAGAAPTGGTAPVSPFPLLTPGTFAPLPALSPSDRWADPESPGTSFLMQHAQAMMTGALNAAATSAASLPPPPPPPQLPSRMEPSSLPLPNFTQDVSGMYQQQHQQQQQQQQQQQHHQLPQASAGLPRVDGAPFLHFGNANGYGSSNGSGNGPHYPLQFPPRMETGGGFHFPSRMESGGTFMQFPPRMDGGFTNFGPLSPRMDAQSVPQAMLPLSPTFGLPPLSPSIMSLPPLSPTFPFSPLGLGSQDFGLNNVYAGFTNNMSPTAGLTSDAFSFPDTVFS